MEQWIDANWTGDIRVYPINDKYVDDLDDYDERRKPHGRTYDD